MQNIWKRVVILGSAGLLCGGLGMAVIQKALAKDGQEGARGPEVRVDAAPPSRDGRLATSYSSVVQKAAPAVVNIFTTKTIQNPHGPGGMAPFTDDPFFRRFFGGPPGGGGRPPRALKQSSLGSGVIITKDGYILTNNHVVEGADEIKVAREKPRREYTAKVVGRDPQTDLAVLKIDGEDLPFVTIADSDKVEVGDVVLALGNPFGVGQTVTLGIVSATGRGGMGIEDYEDFIQTDAAINPGNSGGALVDTEARLIGINTAIVNGGGGFGASAGSVGVGFAIPANLVRNVMDQLMAGGTVSRGFLGVGLQDLTPDLAGEFGTEMGRGVLVTEVMEGSAAESAGIKPRDVIVEFNGKPAADVRSLRLLVSQVKPGTKTEVKLLRESRERTVKVTLKAQPGQSEASAEGEESGAVGDDEGALKGVGVSDLTPALRRQFRVPESVQGAIITQVEEDSASARVGLQPGDVLQEIGRQPVRNAEEAVEACRKSKSASTLVRVWRQGAHRYVVVKER